MEKALSGLNEPSIIFFVAAKCFLLLQMNSHARKICLIDAVLGSAQHRTAQQGRSYSRAHLVDAIDGNS